MYSEKMVEIQVCELNTSIPLIYQEVIVILTCKSAIHDLIILFA